MATTQANAITVESGRTEISFLLFSGKASAERWTSAVYSPSVDVIAIDGHVYEPSKTDVRAMLCALCLYVLPVCFHVGSVPCVV